MTKEKDLLLKYLCMALPYRVIIHIHDINVEDFDNYLYENYLLQIRAHEIIAKPYLRPISSMTEEEEYEFRSFADTLFRYGEDNILCCLPLDAIQWLLEKHFDFMGLIPKNLAIEVTENNNPYRN